MEACIILSHESNRDIAISFLKLVVSGKINDAYSKFVDHELIHHNPYFKGDRESLLIAMEEDARENPNKQLDVKMVLEDEDLVTIYSHIKQTPEDAGFAAVHIFRFDNSRIVELWDVVQAVPEDSQNEHGMF